MSEQLVDAARQHFARSLAALTQDLTRARTLLNDGVNTVMASFDGFRKDIEDQVQSFTRATSALQGTDGTNRGFTGAMDAVLSEFTQQMISTSYRSVRVLSQMSTFEDESAKVVGYAEGIEQIANQTRLISMNARIEAHRAGEAGNVFRVVADDIKVLAKNASDLSQEIRGVAERFTEDLRIIHNDMKSLSAHDMTNTVDSKQRLDKVTHQLDQVTEVLHLTMQRVSQNVGAATRALQFEDIVTELLDCACKKLHQLEGQVGEVLHAAGAHDEALLERTLANFADDVTHPHQVAQQSLQRGEVELF